VVPVICRSGEVDCTNITLPVIVVGCAALNPPKLDGLTEFAKTLPVNTQPPNCMLDAEFHPPAKYEDDIVQGLTNENPAKPAPTPNGPCKSFIVRSPLNFRDVIFAFKLFVAPA